MFDNTELILPFRTNWNKIRQELKVKYTELTDEDLHYVEGHEDELFGRLEQRTGKSQKDLREEVINIYKQKT